MTRTVHKFTFEPEIPMGEIRNGLLLSTIAVEAIYGESAMMIEGKFSINMREWTCVIDAETQLGSDLAKVFAGFMNMYSGGCFRADFTECKMPLGDMLDLCGALIR